MGAACKKAEQNDDDLIIEGESEGENEIELRFICVSNKDRVSSTGEVDPEGKPSYAATIQTGQLVHRRGKWTMILNDSCEATTDENDKSLLSDLVNYNDRFLTIENTTGKLYGLTYDDGECALQTIKIKGTKISNAYWAFKKKEKIYYGSNFDLRNKDTKEISSLRMGTNSVKHNNVLKFNKTLNKALGISETGYMSIETALYRSKTEELVLIPRQFSLEPYSSERKNMDGTNKIIFVKWKNNETSKDLNKKKEKDVRVVELDCTWDRNKGITAINWIDEDQGVIAAVSTTDIEDCVESHIFVFNTKGKIIMEPETFPEEIKYESISIY